MSTERTIWLCAIVAVLCALFWAAPSSDADEPSAERTPIVVAKKGGLQSACRVGDPKTLQHVILISVDGFAPRLFEPLVQTEVLEHLARLQREGLWTHNARTDSRKTFTMPNHFSMITGRPADEGAGLPAAAPHGFVMNYDPGGAFTIHRTKLNPRYKQSIFDVAHDHGKVTGLFSGKGKFAAIVRSYNAEHGAPDLIGDDDGRGKLDVVHILRETSELMDALLAPDRLPELTFLHFRDPDSAGHTMGWGSPEWVNATKLVDAQLGRLLERVDADPKLRGHTAIILTADHGGTGHGHGHARDPNNFTIPFYAWAPGVLAGGRDLYECAPSTRFDPGKAHLPFATARPPVRNADAGNLALELLDLPPLEGAHDPGIRLLGGR